jgi:TRAP-type C4-dicarboxylate transport system permease small subunit
MPDYSLSAMLAQAGTGGLLSLCLVAIGTIFIYMSLGQKQDFLNHTITSTKIMHRGLFWSGLILFVSGCLAVLVL